MKRIAIVAAAFALAVPGTAAAASSSTCQAYNPQLCAVTPASASTATGSPSTGSNSGSGTLPFTGVNVALLVVSGGGLLGAGLCVRRLSSHPE